jgi:glycosyltransferase involved in cell wall biosynthesis
MIQFGGRGNSSDSAEDIDISVVMPCYTEERLASIGAALESLQRQQLRPRAVVVAVDHNDSLANELREKYDWVTIVVNRCQSGASSTRNCGVEAVTTEYTAFFDDDETADAEWLLELTRPFVDSDVVGTGGKYQPVWVDGRPSWFPPEFEWVVGGSYEGMPRVAAPVRNVWSGNMAVRTEAFRHVGGFRTDIGKRGDAYHPEEADLCMRITAATGGHWIYVPAATINHIVPRSRASLRFFLSRCFAEGRGKAVMSIKLQSKSALDMERSYVLSSLRSAMGRLSSFNWHRRSQGLVMLVGLASAAAGYLRARVEWFALRMANRLRS